MKRYGKIAIGTFCMAAATNTVFMPLGIVTGGFSGLGIILWEMFHIPLWVTNVVLNVPVFFGAYYCKKKTFFGIRFLGRQRFLYFWQFCRNSLSFQKTFVLI